MEEAQYMLQQSQEIGLSSVDASYIRAEIAYEMQEYEQASKEAQAVLEGNADPWLCQKAYMLKADAAKAEGDYQGQRTWGKRTWYCKSWERHMWMQQGKHKVRRRPESIIKNHWKFINVWRPWLIPLWKIG